VNNRFGLGFGDHRMHVRSGGEEHRGRADDSSQDNRRVAPLLGYRMPTHGKHHTKQSGQMSRYHHDKITNRPIYAGQRRNEGTAAIPL
jgi:hypothetical protein